MRKWILTENHQILNLDSLNCFWIEDLPSGEYNVLCKDDDNIEWIIGEFHTYGASKDYIAEIFDLLKEKNV